MFLYHTLTHTHTHTHTHTLTHSHTHSRSLSDEALAKGSKKAKMESASGAANVHWNKKVRVAVTEDHAPNHSPSSSTSSETAVLGQSGRDDRRWNSLHYEALKDPQHIKFLMDRYRKQNGKSRNVNAPGPGGFTPLMLAVIRRYNSRDSLYLPSRSSSESSAETNEHSFLIPMNNGMGAGQPGGWGLVTMVFVSVDFPHAF